MLEEKKSKVKRLTEFSSDWKTKHPCNVATVRPPSVVSRYAVAAPLTPPLGLAYIASTLRKSGHVVQLVDSVGEKLDDHTLLDGQMLLRGIRYENIPGYIHDKTDIIGISSMFSSEWPFARKVIEELRKAFPQAVIVGGGEHCTSLPEKILESCPQIDFLVLGEGEESFLELIENISSCAPISQVKGIAYRNKEGKPVRTPPRGRIRNIDDIPYPSWDLVPMSEYLDRNLGLATMQGRSLPMLASRGCPFQCTFCSNKDMWTPRWFPRNPGEILDEFEFFDKQYQLSDIQFFDLTAIVRKDWIIRFSEEIKRRKLEITWQLPVGTRSEAVDREVARALASSGCITMGFAPESGSPKILKRIKKQVKLKSMKKSMRECVEEGLNVKSNIMLGFPGEKHGDVLQTLLFILQMSWIGCHDVSVYPFSPYPGTELFEDLKDSGQIEKIYSDEYYTSLSYVEFSALKNYSEHYNKFTLRCYQFLGYIIFYCTTFLFRPIRIVRLFINLYTGIHETKGATILALFFKRFRLKGG